MTIVVAAAAAVVVVVVVVVVTIIGTFVVTTLHELRVSLPRLFSIA